jgi:hypothetical protein
MKRHRWRGCLPLPLIILQTNYFHIDLFTFLLIGGNLGLYEVGQVELGLRFKTKKN